MIGVQFSGGAYYVLAAVLSVWDGTAHLSNSVSKIYYYLYLTGDKTETLRD